MRKILKLNLLLLLIFVSAFFVACGNNCKDCNPAESVELASAVLGEVEFENADTVKLKNNENVWTVYGNIEAMSAAQSNAFGAEDVTHVVAFKFVFDKEKTIDTFEIKGSITKVYSTDNSKEKYSGSISQLLDNNDGEDAFCYLVLSANTKQYTLTSSYSDGTSSIIYINFDATLVETSAE